MTHKLTISGKLPGLNEYIRACRTNPHAGNKMKRSAEDYVLWQIAQNIQDILITRPVILEYDFFEPNKKRDLDNIASFAMKVIQDVLVSAGVLANDGWNEIWGFTTQFYCDPDNPRIEVAIVEVE